MQMDEFARICHFELTHKLRQGKNCQELSPTILGMVSHQPKDGHPPEGCIIQTRNLAIRLNSQNRWKMMEFDTEDLILIFSIFCVRTFILPISIWGKTTYLVKRIILEGTW